MNLIKIQIVIFFVYIVGYCNSQTIKNVPILFETEEYIPNDRILIVDNNVSDSLKAVVELIVFFKHPLKDTTKCIKVDSVSIIRMHVTSLNNQKKIIDYGYDNNNGTTLQKYIWNLFDKKLGYWYRNQPYDIMIGRDQWEKKIILGGVFYIVPKKLDCEISNY